MARLIRSGSTLGGSVYRAKGVAGNHASHEGWKCARSDVPRERAVVVSQNEASWRGSRRGQSARVYQGISDPRLAYFQI